MKKLIGILMILFGVCIVIGIAIYFVGWTSFLIGIGITIGIILTALIITIGILLLIK